MSLTKEKVDNNVEKILYNNKPASLLGVVIIKDLSKKGWIIVDCSIDDKISRGMNNVANQLGVKLNINNFYCKYEGTESLKENQRYDIVAELFLSKGTTLYGKIKKLNIVSSDTTLSDNINISNKEKSFTSNKEKSSTSNKVSEKRNENVSLQNFSGNITLSDETINKIKLVMKEAFSEVLKETTKNLSDLVEVIKELTVVIDKKEHQSVDYNKDIEVPFDEKDISNDLSDDIPKDLSNDLPNDLSNDLPIDDTKK